MKKVISYVGAGLAVVTLVYNLAKVDCDSKEALRMAGRTEQMLVDQIDAMSRRVAALEQSHTNASAQEGGAR